MSELEFQGAARRTTGSLHLFRHKDATLSMDCGLFQGRRSESRELNRTLPVRPRELDKVILSHAHIDHSGRLPVLAKQGYQGPIYATPPTVGLCSVMLPDSGHIQEEDARFWNEKRAESPADEIEPIYTVDDAMATLPLFKSIAYDTPFEVCEGCTATFLEAGHMLGSAMVLLEVDKMIGSTRILYTGDMGRFRVPILKDPTCPLPEVDYLITECTYADRRHDNPTDMKEKLCAIVKETAALGGKVIIPAFSVGRTQTVIYYLLQLFHEGRLEKLPVYVDSPLSARATDIYSRHPECYDREAIEEWGEDGGDLFGRSGEVRYITDVNDSKALNERSEPCIIVAASGMCEAGRIKHHLKNNIENDKNTVVVVGFMAQHTLGRRIVERREELKIYGRIYPLLARVEVLNGFSAHADVDEFRKLYEPLAPKLKKAFVVHGEETQPAAMAAMLAELGAKDVAIPAQGEKFDV